MNERTPRETPCYCVNFRGAANTLTKIYDRALSPLNITASQFSLLNDINALGVCNKTGLGKFVGLDRTTIVRNVNILRDKGFVEDGAGSRESLITLTEAGKRVIAEGYVQWKKVQKRIKSAIGPNNLNILKEVFEAVESLNTDRKGD